jgi:hypothetical protein
MSLIGRMDNTIDFFPQSLIRFSGVSGCGVGSVSEASLYTEATGGVSGPLVLAANWRPIATRLVMA